jgi:CRISPR associated protein Cas1
MRRSTPAPRSPPHSPNSTTQTRSTSCDTPKPRRPAPTGTPGAQPQSPSRATTKTASPTAGAHLVAAPHHSQAAPGSRSTPGCAILNFLYALAENETTLALRAVGLDPGIGIVHRDQPARDSLALDLLEAVRPAVDDYLLTLLRERTFAARDFYETRRGTVRILPPLTHQLAQTLPAWAERIQRRGADLSRPR